MNQQRPPRLVKLSAGRRSILLVVAGIGWCLLATASRLEPDPRGFGTHEQLGLSPCWIIARTGLPCPTCGMTTCWSLASRGRWAEAAACNGVGLLAFLATALGSFSALVASALGRGPQISKPFELAAACGGALVLALVLDWLRRLAV
ncbi:MAG: DUF2752 domain-containing protein [Planctomycetota bacterium]